MTLEAYGKQDVVQADCPLEMRRRKVAEKKGEKNKKISKAGLL